MSAILGRNPAPSRSLQCFIDSYQLVQDGLSIHNANISMYIIYFISMNYETLFVYTKLICSPLINEVCIFPIFYNSPI